MPELSLDIRKEWQAVAAKEVRHKRTIEVGWVDDLMDEMRDEGKGKLGTKLQEGEGGAH